MEHMLTQCLSKICEAMHKEPLLEKKIKLVDDVTEFLLVTPDVFSSTDLSWRQVLYECVKHLISNKMPSGSRIKVFKLISALVHGYGRINWFMTPDGVWCEADVKYFNLLSRYVCVEIVLMLDDGRRQEFDSEFFGSLLITLEHCLTCLCECDAIASFLSPDEISALIISIRSAAIAMIEFACLHEHDDDLSLVIQSIVRLVSLWIREDSDGVSTSAGNAFVEVVVTVLSRPSSNTNDSHELIHAAVTSITDLPSECISLVREHRKDIGDLLTICRGNSDPESSCRTVCDSFCSFIDEDLSCSLQDRTSNE